MYRIHPIDFDESVARLLRANSLPTADLDQARARFLGAIDGGRLLGCVAIEDCGDAALLRSLAVDAEARGGGLGTALVAVAEQRARELGHAALYLLTTDASEFFIGHGYAAAERGNAPRGVASTAQFSGLCPASSHFMWKPLQGLMTGIVP
ncbi:amino-acid N-acetyltransferase [Luteimonas cucumeris]|uniref:Amino-acid N-acetyltransferase n=1 Tax=Luteimonas cucumeris TaxID=985012 RepID=A0A562L205_9GAMM|nr:arsenic resistance N-acetyltransferase ArsN2 [Luteimonas cucumeris]TWI01665.1 amino-acid N-acetyltransferase [Luteimonas cucumeris]